MWLILSIYPRVQSLGIVIKTKLLPTPNFLGYLNRQSFQSPNFLISFQLYQKFNHLFRVIFRPRNLPNPQGCRREYISSLNLHILVGISAHNNVHSALFSLHYASTFNILHCIVENDKHNQSYMRGNIYIQSETLISVTLLLFI